MIYWHCTPHTRTAAILREGLRLGKRRQWRNPLGFKIGSLRHIYLFSDFDAAIELAGRMEWGLISGNKRCQIVDILEIHADPPVKPDPNIEAQCRPGTWWMTDQPIPATVIVKVIRLTLPMKQDFIARRDAGLRLSTDAETVKAIQYMHDAVEQINHRRDAD